MKEPQEAPTAERVATPYSWYVLSVLVIVYILNFIDRQIISILALDIKRDLDLMIRVGREAGIPVVVGSAINAGADRQLAEAVAMVKAIAAERGLSFKLAVISGQVSQAWLASAPCSLASRRFARPGWGMGPWARRWSATSGGQGRPVTGA